MKKTIIVPIVLVAFMIVAWYSYGLYFSMDSCTDHANTSQRCKAFGPFWKAYKNSNDATNLPASQGGNSAQIDAPLPKYSTAKECSLHANTSLKCIQDPADKLWYVTSSNHP